MKIKSSGLLEKAEKIRNADEKANAVEINTVSSEKNIKTSGKFNLRIFTFILGFILLCVICGGVYIGLKKFTEVKYDKNHALIEKQLSLCQELVSAKYRYSDIIVIKKSMGFSKSYSIVKYTGLLRAGIADVADIEFNLSKDGKSVTVKLPDAELLGNDLVSQEVFDERQSIFVPITTQEVFDEIEEARQDFAENMMAEGFLDEARTYAVKIISQTLTAAGFENVQVR